MIDAPQFTRRRALALALGCGAVAGFAAPGARAETFRRVGAAFGTTVSVTLLARDAAQAEAAFAAAFAQIRHVDKIASLHRPDSEISRLNRDGFFDRPDPALTAMLAMAAEMHAASEGAFDISVQPLWLAFDAAAKAGGWPDAGEIARIGAHVDAGRIAFDARQVRFGLPGMGITLNGLAQGYAADRVALALAGAGITQAFIDTGELAARGARPDGAPWRAALQHPRDRAASLGLADVAGCLATSGDYQYFWSPDFARNHIIDPRSGASPTELATACVLAKTGLLADALSTAVFVTGVARGRALLERFGAEALFVDKAGAMTMTPNFPFRRLDTASAN